MKRAPTVLDVAVNRLGLRKGMQVGTFIAQWTIAQQDLGREPTLEEAADWWRESHATWYRRQVDFRRAFPGIGTPGPIAESVIRKRADRIASKREIGSVLGLLGAVSLGAPL